MFRFFPMSPKKDSDERLSESALRERKHKCSVLERLSQMRDEKAHGSSDNRCRNLLTRLHNDCSPLNKVHSNETWGRRYWSSKTHFEGDGLTFCYNREAGTGMPICNELDLHEAFVDDLLYAEHEWQRAQSGMLAHEDSDDYWIKQYKEAKRHCEALKAACAGRGSVEANCVCQNN